MTVVLRWWKLTQLLVILAKIIAQVGIFDNKSRRDGNFPFFPLESVFPAWINRSSDLLTKGLSRGSSVATDDHVVIHSSPRDEKRKKGPVIPIVANIIGVRTKPTTLPRWNPAMEIPTALARSWLGNHLTKDTHPNSYQSKSFTRLYGKWDCHATNNCNWCFNHMQANT